MRLRAHALTALTLGALALCGTTACRRAAPQSASNAAVQAVLSGKPRATAAVWQDAKSFYAQREMSPAWVSDKGRVRQAAAILSTLAAAGGHGLSGDFGRPELDAAIVTAGGSNGDIATRVAAIADLDVRITTALMAIGRDVALGRSSPGAVDARWKAKRTPPDFVTLLSARVDRGLDSWLESVQPVHPEYARLMTGLKTLEGQHTKGGWPAVHASALRPGRRDSAVIALRQRLAASGELSGEAAASLSADYDAAVVAGVKAFQEHHTLAASGAADAATIAAMNVPIEARIAQIAINLERWRWMPDDFGDRHFLVNIPSYHVVAREHGTDVLDIRVVVGKPGHETPIFSGNMATVVFSPYWNIPDAIAEGETMPALMRDKRYLERNHIEVRRASKTGSEPIDASHINWEDEGETKGLMFRQLPGADNALGHVKFLFPNPFEVYLHDTPADSLFSRTGRAFSHGCVRVEEPETLAKYVLQGTEWDEAKILEAMNAGVERPVTLPKTIPVHIVYFTASVDEHGGIHLLNDVYGYDRKQGR